MNYYVQKGGTPNPKNVSKGILNVKVAAPSFKPEIRLHAKKPSSEPIR